MTEAEAYMQAFGEAMRECRKRAGMRQTELADEIGCTPNEISKIERGLLDCGLKRVLEICRATRHELYAGKHLVKEAKDVAGLIASERIRRKLTWTTLEEMTGVSDTTLKYIWRGEQIQGARISNVMRVLRVLGMPLGGKTI